MWAGPVANWIAACDRILALDAARDRPRPRSGHRRLRRARRPRYLRVRPRRGARALRRRHGAGDAAVDIDLADFADWGDPERIAVNVATLYREFDPSRPPPCGPELFVRMARWSRRH